MKKKPDSDGAESIEHERKVCPICGSGNIEQQDGGYFCNNCSSSFPRPKKTKIEIRKKPRYIG